MSTVPSGGPANINGINYQMLWALSTLGSFQGKAVQAAGGSLTSATLILEPSKGGDQQQVLGTKRVVVQLKARSDGGTWSLQEVVRDVLPDLYLAVEPNEEVEYHFVTEGTWGKWEEVETFFDSLAEAVPSDPLAHLDDANPLKFRRNTRPSKKTKEPPFWDNNPYTQRRLFERIVQSLRESRAEIGKESLDVTRRKTRALLAGFQFRGGYRLAGLKSEVDRWLLARIGSADELETRRNAMLQDLAFRATCGHEPVEPDKFFQHHRLDAGTERVRGTHPGAI